MKIKSMLNACLFCMGCLLMVGPVGLAADTWDQGNTQQVVSPKIIHHDNGELCWKDPKVYKTDWSHNNSGAVHYSNQQLCWKDPKVYKTDWGHNNSGAVYHSNGQLCWKDPKVYKTDWGHNNSGAAYYSNGQVCWKDPKVYKTDWGHNNSGALYHANGQVCWKDPKVYKTDWSKNDSGIIYHANGKVCWKDPELYSDGGKCYDSAGKFIKPQGLNTIYYVDLENGSSLEIYSEGAFKASMHMGDQSYFVRSYDGSTNIVQNLGSAYYFYLPCSGMADKSVWVFDEYNNWILISENK